MDTLIICKPGWYLHLAGTVHSRPEVLLLSLSIRSTKVRSHVFSYFKTKPLVLTCFESNRRSPCSLI